MQKGREYVSFIVQKPIEGVDTYTQLIYILSLLEHIELQDFSSTAGTMERPYSVYETLRKSLRVMNVAEWAMELYELWDILDMQKLKK